MGGSMQQLLVGYGASGGGSGTPASWNPGDRNAGFTPDVTNKIATHTVGFTQFVSGRSVESHPASDVNGRYAEFTITEGSANGTMIGIATSSASLAGGAHVGIDAHGYAYYSNAKKYNNNVAVNYGVTWTTGDKIGVLLKAGEVTFYKNGVSQGMAYTGLSGTFFLMGSLAFATSSLTLATRLYPLPAGSADWA